MVRLFYSENQTFKLCTTIVLSLLIRDTRNNYTIVPLLNFSQGRIWLQILCIVIKQAVIKKNISTLGCCKENLLNFNQLSWLLSLQIKYFKQNALFSTQYSHRLRVLTSVSDFPDRQKSPKHLIPSKLNQSLQNGRTFAFQNIYSNMTYL